MKHYFFVVSCNSYFMLMRESGKTFVGCYSYVISFVWIGCFYTINWTISIYKWKSYVYRIGLVGYINFEAPFCLKIGQIT